MSSTLDSLLNLNQIEKNKGTLACNTKAIPAIEKFFKTLNIKAEVSTEIKNGGLNVYYIAERKLTGSEDLYFQGFMLGLDFSDNGYFG